MKKKPIKLLCYFDYKCTTGFSTVSTNVLRGIKKQFDGVLYTDIVAINYLGQDYKTQDGRTAVFSAKNNDPDSDPFGRKFFLKMLQDHSYDLVFMIQDIGIVMPMVEVMRSIKKDKGTKAFKTIYYYPLDGTPLPEWFDDFDFFDQPVAYTEYAKHETLKAKPELEDRISVILHGVDTKEFFPLENDAAWEFRKAYFGEENAYKTIYGNINRNQPRKNIPLTISAFAEYKRKNGDDSFLYLHLDPHDSMGWDIPTIAKQYGLVYGKDYKFPSEEEMETARDAGFLNCIYNALDFFITTTSGEGFGLTIVEAMACKVPVIALRHTSITELAGVDRMWAIPSPLPYITHFDNMVRYQADPTDVVAMMRRAKDTPDRTADKVDQAFQFARSLDWKIINHQWASLFEKLV
jgi:glycosyltransferase involved in cell wall biosynthesis